MVSEGLAVGKLMVNRVSTASSTEETTARAVEVAISAAKDRLPGAQPRVGFLFAGSRHDLGAATQLACRLSGAHMLGASTAGEFTESGLSQGGVAVLLLATDDPLLTRIARVRDGENIAAPLCDGWLEMSRDAIHGKRANSISILLVDGLSGVGPLVVDQVRHGTRPYQTIVGGAAGDDGLFQRTRVALDGRSHDNGAAVVHLFTRAPWSVGIGHGLVTDGQRMLVTQSDGATVHQIDHKPAFEVYREHAAARGIDLDPGFALPYMTEHQLGLFFLDRLQCARAAVKVLPDGAVRYAGPVPRGSAVCFLAGEAEAMNTATQHAVEAAVAEREVAGLLVFSCICRKAMLGAQFSREIETIHRVAGANVPVAGFLTYGEIARCKGKLEGWHNTTTVVVGIPA